MHIVTFTLNSCVHHGALVGDRIRIHPTATSAVELAINPSPHAPGEEVALADVTLLAPVPRPGKIICVGLNYRAHAAEGGKRDSRLPLGVPARRKLAAGAGGLDDTAGVLG